MLHTICEVTGPEFELLQRYVGYPGDERVLLAQYEAEPKSFSVHSYIVLRLAARVTRQPILDSGVEIVG